MKRASTKWLMVLAATALTLFATTKTPSSRGVELTASPSVNSRTFAAGASPRVTCSVAAVATQSQDDVWEWSRLRITRDLRNEDAMTYLSGRATGDRTFREIQGKAAAMLRERGLKPTRYARVSTIVVPRRQLEPKNALLMGLTNLLVRPVRAEEYDGYEVYMQSWDDGDDSTWEGNVWIQQISTGQWVSANEQQQLPPSPNAVNWADQVGSSQRPLQQCRKTGSVCGYCLSWEAAMCNLQRGIEDNWTYCAAAALGCAFTGPAYPECVTTACYTAFLAGYLNRTRQHFATCWLDEAERELCEGGDVAFPNEED